MRSYLPPNQFAKLAKTRQCLRIWQFLNTTESLLRMRVATELRRPAIEGIIFQLDDLCVDASDHIKRMVGHMIRQLLEDQGYRLQSQGVKVRIGHFMSRASRYLLPEFLPEALDD